MGKMKLVMSRFPANYFTYLDLCLWPWSKQLCLFKYTCEHIRCWKKSIEVNPCNLDKKISVQVDIMMTIFSKTYTVTKRNLTEKMFWTFIHIFTLQCGVLVKKKYWLSVIFFIYTMNYEHLFDPFVIEKVWLPFKRWNRTHVLLFITNFHVPIIVSFNRRTTHQPPIPSNASLDHI